MQKSLLLSLCICYSQMTAEMPPSVIAGLQRSKKCQQDSTTNCQSCFFQIARVGLRCYFFDVQFQCVGVLFWWFFYTMPKYWCVFLLCKVAAWSFIQHQHLIWVISKKKKCASLALAWCKALKTTHEESGTLSTVKKKTKTTF